MEKTATITNWDDLEVATETNNETDNSVEKDLRCTKELLDTWAIKGYSKKNSDFEEWSRTRIEDLAKRKKKLSSRKFENNDDEKEDEKWIEINKEIINEEIKVLREKSVTTEEKREKGWFLCQKEMKIWETRKTGSKGNKRKK